jgi:formate/nitrite transporter
VTNISLGSAASEIDFDAYAPQVVAERVESQGIRKARMPLLTLATLGTLAGGFIGLGALYFTLVTSDHSLPFAASRVLGGLAFSLGLILVVVAGAELFTGDNLLVMAWAGRRISTGEILRVLTIVYVTNFIGAFGLVVLVVLSGVWRLSGTEVGKQAVSIAAAKVALPFGEAFFRGALCNVLVCLAIWLTQAGRSVTDKIWAIIFPISAFVALGFEHSVANMYFIPLGIVLKDRVDSSAVAQSAALTWIGMFRNLIPVTAGNLVGGGIMVALVYYLVYRARGASTP